MWKNSAKSKNEDFETWSWAQVNKWAARSPLRSAELTEQLVDCWGKKNTNGCYLKPQKLGAGLL